MKINTHRLFLEKLDLKHAEAFYAYRSDAETNKYQGWIPYALEDCKHFIKNRIAKQINEDDSWFQFAIILKDTNTLVGDLGVHFIENNQHQVEIGCTISKEFHQNGIASEALIAVIDYLFSDLKKHRITASIDPNNIASIKMVEKIGFRKEAHFKESLLVNGVWTDDVIYAVLEKEWLKNR
jgi:RimJ/RimL family protein N-acetyltransferase